MNCNCKFYLESNQLFVSYEWLRTNGVLPKTIEMWVVRGAVFPVIQGKKRFIGWDEIPAPTIAKLPAKELVIAELRTIQHGEKVNEYYSKMARCKENGFVKHVEHYTQNFKMSRENVIKSAQLHAVWEYIINLINNEMCRDTAGLYQSFNKCFPGKYGSYHSFANAKGKALAEGAESVAVKQSIFTAPKNVKKVSVLNQFWVNQLVSIGKKFSNREVFQMLSKMCVEAGEKIPSQSWVDKYRTLILKQNIQAHSARNGAKGTSAAKMPTASMQQALYAGDQFQVDGVATPFWGIGTNGKYQRFQMVVVKDAYSKKIVSFSVGESENTLVIMDAIGGALRKTGFLPYEFVMDNHSYNKTQEAINFKDEVTRLGGNITVTSNPRQKVVVERGNQDLNRHFKQFEGYLGEGIKSRNVNAHPKQEMIDEAAQKQHSKDKVLGICLLAATALNEEINPKTGKSPNQLFDESEKPYVLKLSEFDRPRLLTAKSAFKVSHGQINIKRGMETYEFQLPKRLYALYDQCTVAVRYENLNEEIYMYDIDTDEHIEVIPRKTKIHAALANQTEADREKLLKHKGRLKGIETDAKKANEELERKALAANPDAYLYLNKQKQPKDVLQAIEQSAHLKREALEMGINLSLINIGQKFDNTDSQPTAKKRKNDPFAPKNHVISMVQNRQDN